MIELSVLIPSKNERLLDKTLLDLQHHKSPRTEVLYAEDDCRGQRMTTTMLAEKAVGKYIMKTDAHCSFAPLFDEFLLEEIDDRTILAPTLMPLEPESWAINGKKRMNQFVFDTNFVMQHAEGGAGDTMCLQGSCWMVSRENYFAWNLGDPSMPSWGGQAVELGIKAFLNGGRCRTTSSTFYGHVFRHSDEEFPYDRGANPGRLATQELIGRYKNKSIVPLIERFNYPADWTKELCTQL